MDNQFDEYSRGLMPLQSIIKGCDENSLQMILLSLKDKEYLFYDGYDEQLLSIEESPSVEQFNKFSNFPKVSQMKIITDLKNYPSYCINKEFLVLCIYLQGSAFTKNPSVFLPYNSTEFDILLSGINTKEEVHREVKNIIERSKSGNIENIPPKENKRWGDFRCHKCVSCGYFLSIPGVSMDCRIFNRTARPEDSACPSFVNKSTPPKPIIGGLDRGDCLV